MFNYKPIQNQTVKVMKQSEYLNAHQAVADSITAITFVTMAEQGNIDDVTATEHIDLFASWEANVRYCAGDVRKYDDKLYRCVQPHMSQPDWSPDSAASLWSAIGDPAEEYPAWSQPIGAHDAYNTGDKCSYNEMNWISVVDSNVWEPGTYGWEEVTSE